MVFITGDCHSNFHRFSTDNFPDQREMTKSDTVIICGDFGGVWSNDSEQRYWLDWLNDKSFTTVFVDGNHENFDLLETFPVVDFHGGKAHQIRDSIFHLMRGYCFNFEGKKFFAFGGASSHDIDDGILNPFAFENLDEFTRTYKQWSRAGKMFRVKGFSWWEHELPTDEEMQRGIETLEANNYEVDYVISHCLPQDVISSIGYCQPDKLTMYFNDLLNRGLKFKRWIGGHYHENRRIMCAFDILYERIERLL